MKKYSILSNYIYLHKPLFKEEKGYMIKRFLVVILSVVVPLIGTMLSAFIVWLLEIEKSTYSIIGAIIAVFLGYGLVNLAQTYVMESAALQHIEIRVVRYINAIMERGMKIPLEKLEDPDTIKGMQKANYAVNGNQWGVEGFFRMVSLTASGLLGLIVYLAIMGTINPIVMLLLTVIAILTSIFHYLPTTYHKHRRDDFAKYAVTMDYIDEKIAGDSDAGKDIRAYGLTDYIIGKYEDAIRAYRKLYSGLYGRTSLAEIADITLSAVRDLVCYVYLIMRLKEGMSIAEFVFYLGIIGGLSAWLQDIAVNIARLINRNNEVSNYRNFLDDSDEIRDNVMPENGFSNIDIVFDHVIYVYGKSDRKVLDDVSFHIVPGEHIALVGLNGAGKSTIVKLLSGLYMPTEGDIYINGVNTREINLEEYFRHEAAVFQDAFTLSYSIAENIALCEEYDEARVKKAIDIAGLKDKIEMLPEGIKTYMGKDIREDGINLSGGETQKLLLARALYRNPSLLLLDEPTAALDALAEKEIYEIYNEVLNGVTSLFISHRLASTRFCSRIILLEEGKIIEEGNHDTLMDKKGVYYELFKLQSKYYEEGGTGDVA